MPKPRFVKKVIAEIKNDVPPAPMNTFSAVGDINNDGWLDVVVSGRNGKMVWVENKDEGKEWVVHLVDDQVESMECGGSLYDLTGNGYLDIINGGADSSTRIYWWENPGPKGGKWKKRLIADTSYRQFHDTIIGDIKNDGKMYLVFTNQRGENGGTNIYCVPLPDNPTVSPWPNLEIIATGKTELNPFRKEGVQPEEGLAIGDIDGDGRNELVAGTHWYKYMDGKWECHKFASGYITTKAAIGDIDGDGKNEIVLSEGDPCIYGKRQGGKIGWFKPGKDINDLWEEHVVDDYLLDAHSLQLGDICGNRRLDILVGEIGVADKSRNYIIRKPRIMIYENMGNGEFIKHIVDEGTGIHDAVLADMRNKGVLDIVGKPLHGDEMWKLHVYLNNTGV